MSANPLCPKTERERDEARIEALRLKRALRDLVGAVESRILHHKPPADPVADDALRAAAALIEERR